MWVELSASLYVINFIEKWTYIVVTLVTDPPGDNVIVIFAWAFVYVFSELTKLIFWNLFPFVLCSLWYLCSDFLLSLFFVFSNYHSCVSRNHLLIKRCILVRWVRFLSFTVEFIFLAWRLCHSSGSLQFFPHVQLETGSLDVPSLIILERAHLWEWPLDMKFSIFCSK